MTPVRSRTIRVVTQTPAQPPSHSALVQDPQRSMDASGSTSASSLQCSVCGRIFSRPSHHDRHFRTHLPPEGRPLLPCDRCHKSFGRKDVLLRHLRTAHGIDPGPQPKALQKSCYRCVQLRRKCDREQPCRMCAVVGAVCQYPGKPVAGNTAGPGGKPSLAATMPLRDHPQQQQRLPSYEYLPPQLSETSHAQMLHDDLPVQQQQLYHNGQPSAYPSLSQPQTQSMPHSQLPLHERHRGYDDSLSGVGPSHVPLGQGGPGHETYLSTTGSHSMPSVSSAPPAPSASAQSGPSTSGVSPSFSDDYYLAPDTLTFASSLSAAGQLDFRGTGLDWLAFDVPDMYTPTDSAGLPGADSPLVTQAPLNHLSQQPTSHPLPLATQLPSQSHAQYPALYVSQQSPYQPERPSSAHYYSYPNVPAVPHGSTGSSQCALAGPQTAAAPYSSSAYPSDPLCPPSSHPSVGQTAGVHEPPTSLLPWSFQEGPHDRRHRRYSLPPLREVLQNNLLQSNNPAPSDKSVLANLVVLLSDTRVTGAPDADDARHGNPDGARNIRDGGVDDGLPSVPAPMSMDSGMEHATNFLMRLVDIYITKFQPILPLIHLPTWDIATAPRVLVSAMACVGSLLADDNHIKGFALSISDICMPMIAWMGSSDSANYRDISYLSALCVHQIYSLGSGNRQLYQNADRSRGILVGGLRGMGCLTTRLSLEDQAVHAANASFAHGTGQQHPNGGAGTAPTAPAAGDPPSLTPALQEQWLSWMYREREKRTAWSSFEYDCSLCTLTGRRGAVDLSELPSRLPCAEALWDAPSATAWAALRTQLHPDAQGALISVVVRGALLDDPVDSSSESGSLPSMHSSTGTTSTHTKNQGVSFWGKRLCAQVIGRLLWDLKQLETLAGSEYFGMPSLSSAQTASKVRLLRALDNLLMSMDQPITMADLISNNIASLIGHYSHLYTAQDVLDIILYIVRNTVAHGAHRLRHHKGIHMAKRRLVATLSRDPQEARRLVYHAAQIVAVASDYLVSAPCEILRLFMGYTFLIVFAAYCPSSYRYQLPDAGAPGAGAEAIQLGVSSHRIASTADVDNWIAHGGPAAIGSVPNLFAEGGALAICRDAQATMQCLKNWGLAEKFTKILQSFEATALAELSA